MSRNAIHATLCVIAMSFFISPALAGWMPTGIPASTSPADQFAPTVVSHGSDGVHVLWREEQAGGVGIYGTAFGRNGTTWYPPQLSAPEGTAFANPAKTTAPDGAGGIIAVWNNFNGSDWDIRAQRIDGNGIALWGPNGVPVCEASGDQTRLHLITDGAGGAFCVWADERTPANDQDIYMQRMNAFGTMLWATDGVGICTALTDQSAGQPVSDGMGGVALAWYDVRNGTYDIRIARVDGAGNALWTPDGVALVTSPDLIMYHEVVADGIDGAIASWCKVNPISPPTKPTFIWFARRFDFLATPHWPSSGVLICTDASSDTDAALIADGDGGVIFAWADPRNGTDDDIYAARINYNGSHVWDPLGVPVCTAGGNQLEVVMAPDGDHGAVLAWSDQRGGATGSDIFAARLDANGTPVWTPDGVPVCTAANVQRNPGPIQVGKSPGPVQQPSGVFITWEDLRDGHSQVYLQRLDLQHGEWGHPEPVLISAEDVPGDQGGFVALQWEGTERPELMSHYTILREDDTDGDGIGDTWEDAGWIDINTEGTVVPTTSNWPKKAPFLHRFIIRAHEVEIPHDTFESNMFAGHSVDDIVPDPPVALATQRIGEDVELQWDPTAAPDLEEYAVYRSPSPGVTPEPGNFLASATGPSALDTNAPAAALYYIVTARDVNGNESAPSNESSVGTVTGIGDSPAITRLTLLDNVPNPFSTTTRLLLGMPRPGDVRVDVFDIAGRRVRQESFRASAGWRGLEFDARGAHDTLPSGVYFYRVRAAGESRTAKLVIAR